MGEQSDLKYSVNSGRGVMNTFERHKTLCWLH